jgi:hypothetical protein
MIPNQPQKCNDEAGECRSLGLRQLSSKAPFCRINAAFQLLSERRIYAAAKVSVVRKSTLRFSGMFGLAGVARIASTVSGAQPPLLQ